MKRTMIAAVILLLLAAAAATAHADGPVNPYREEVMKLERESLSQRYENQPDQLLRGSSDYQDNISCSGKIQPCQTLTFSAQLNHTQFTANELCFKWDVYDTGRDSGTMFSHSHDVGTDTFEYYFYSAGTYYVKYYAILPEYKDSDYWVRFTEDSGYMEFTIPEDGVHPTLEEKAAEICKACKGASKWDTALNLYEWLTDNCDYDYNYHLYGPDILFSHSGVCDAFSKAYVLLLETAGIPADRAFGQNHAWNVLKLGGKWYQADPTWDDWGTHEFFCVSAAAMIPVPSHSYEDGSQGGEHAEECTSMDANYYIHTGKWRDELGDYIWDEDYNKKWLSCKEQAENKLTDGETRFTVECGNRDGCNEFQYPSIANAVVGAGLKADGIWLEGDRVKFRTEALSSIEVDVSILDWDLTETGTLKLPESLHTVDEETYAGTKATKVVIPSGCTRIGKKAFRNSGIRSVVIPDSVTFISSDAFAGCQKKIFFITENNKAKSYAEARGILVISP